MSRWAVKAKVIGFSLMLLTGGTLAIAFTGLPWYSYHAEEYTRQYPFAFNVTIDEPQWNYNINDWPTREIGITDLETNDTPVNLLFLNSDGEAVLLLTNVTQINNASVMVSIYDESMIIVQRTSADAIVSLVVLISVVIPPPPVAIISPLPMILFWSAVAIIGFLKLVLMRIHRDETKLETRSQGVSLRWRIQPSWIAILVLVSVILTAPYIQGTLDGSFTPIEQVDRIDQGSHIFTLNEANPTSNLEIGAYGGDFSYDYEISPQVNTGMMYQMMLQDTDGLILLEFAVENSSVAWHISGSSIAGVNCTLRLERTNNDVEIGFSYLVTRTVMRPDVDPTPSMIGAIAGLGVLFLALLLGFAVEGESVHPLANNGEDWLSA